MRSETAWSVGGLDYDGQMSGEQFTHRILPADTLAAAASLRWPVVPGRQPNSRHYCLVGSERPW